MRFARRKSASRWRTTRTLASASASSSRAKRTASSRACSERRFTSALERARIARAIAWASSGVKALARTWMMPVFES